VTRDFDDAAAPGMTIVASAEPDMTIQDRSTLSGSPAGAKFRAYSPAGFRRTPYWERLSPDYRVLFDSVTEVLPFRVNDFTLEHLIDWTAPDGDPMFRLMFPQEGMLTGAQVAAVARAKAEGREPLRAVVRDIRESLNPHPAGQQTDNRAWLDGEPVDGIQHKYAETVLFFPSAGQTCHAYCSFCFRWAQFVGEPDWKIQAREAAQAAAYLRAHPEVTDILITGGDPAIMPTRVLARYIEPFLEVESLRTIRIGTKALSYWPGRFTKDDDADDLMRLFERVVASGRHLAVMAHLNHWRELEPAPVQDAVARLRGAGAVLRTQGPILANINDDADTWARLWERSVALGMVPYYMFMERDTGPADYFRVPLLRAWEIYTDAQRRVSGLARSARGPVMSAHPGKVVLDGPVETGAGAALSLRFLQARDAALTGRPFLARYDDRAGWLDDLRPAPGTAFPHERPPE